METGQRLALLSLSLIALLMSLRKRWSAFRPTTYAGWRVIHVIVGALALAVTGLSLGHNLNFAFALDFLLLMLLGAVTVEEGTMR